MEDLCKLTSSMAWCRRNAKTLKYCGCLVGVAIAIVWFVMLASDLSLMLELDRPPELISDLLFMFVLFVLLILVSLEPIGAHELTDLSHLLTSAAFLLPVFFLASMRPLYLDSPDVGEMSKLYNPSRYNYSIGDSLGGDHSSHLDSTSLRATLAWDRLHSYGCCGLVGQDWTAWTGQRIPKSCCSMPAVVVSNSTKQTVYYCEYVDKQHAQPCLDMINSRLNKSPVFFLLIGYVFLYLSALNLVVFCAHFMKPSRLANKVAEEAVEGLCCIT